MPRHILLFGARGSIGSFIADQLRTNHPDITVHRTSSSRIDDHDLVRYDDACDDDIAALAAGAWSGVRFDGVVWAQGINLSDDLSTFNHDRLMEALCANASFIVRSCGRLLAHDLLSPRCRMVVISSIYEHHSRPRKLTYTLTKSMIGGVVRSLSCDPGLGPDMLINSLCPGPIDNAMTIRTLSPDQMDRVTGKTRHRRLVSLHDVWVSVRFLLLENTGIDGQSITLDLGMTAGLDY